MTEKQIFKSFYHYAKDNGIKIIYGSEGIAECPYFSLKEKLFHLITKDENVLRLREMLHEWTHSTFIKTKRETFNDYPLEELVAEKTAYDIMCHYNFYDEANRENYVWKFKHASYINFWLERALEVHKDKSVSEIIDIVEPHILASKEIIIDLIEKEEK